MVLVIKVFKLLFIAVSRLYYSAINNHGNVFFLALNFCINFSPIFIWLAIFKNAGIIPHEWRPTIHVKLVYYGDLYMYAFNLVGIICGLLTMLFGYFLYVVFFKVRLIVATDKEFAPLPQLDDAIGGSTSSAALNHHDAFEIDSNPEEEYELDTLPNRNSGKSSTTDDDEEQEYKSSVLTKVASTRSRDTLKKKFNYNYPPGYSPILITLLFCLSWPILNLDFYFAQPDFISKNKDIFAWVFYVLCHLIVPIVTAVYLYVFHAPDALKYFSIILGCQNISGVFTHLLFPNAPPWFIHLNGIDIEPSYEMPGFAAGLTRVDVAMGTHLNTKGFHKSPIVFGAFPSLHSAMAVQVFLHVNHYSNWWVVKILGFLFVVIQWWATIYLDHHFRLDLIAGLFYAYFYYIVFQKKLFLLQKNFYNNYFYNKNILGTTMGMRVFKGTFMERFFDPYK